MDIEIKKLKEIVDERGSLVEAIGRDSLNKKKFGHLFFVTFRNKKAVRGNHFHNKNHEYYIVLEGKISVELVDVKTGKKKKIILDSKKRERLRIGPLIAHASKSISPNSLLLAYNSEPYDKKNPDAILFKVI